MVSELYAWEHITVVPNIIYLDLKKKKKKKKKNERTKEKKKKKKQKKKKKKKKKNGLLCSPKMSKYAGNM